MPPPACLPPISAPAPAHRPIQTQLEQLGKPQLKQRAMNLRDIVGAARLPPMQNSISTDAMISWIIQVQVMLLGVTGVECTPDDFGVPKEFGQVEQAYFGHSAPGPPVSGPPAEAGGDVDPELVSAHAEARRGAEAAKQRNRGQGLW